MDTVTNYFMYSPFVGLAGFVFVIASYFWVVRQPAGNAKMREIAGLIEAGSMTFLKKEYSILFVFLVVVAALLGMALSWDTSLCYLAGAFTSMTCGFIGMKAATKANVRTAEAAAQSGQGKALSVAFYGGSIMGMSVASLGLFGLAVAYYLLAEKTTIEALNGFAMGASSIALFARIGGGIYTKAADVGADLVGKVEAGIPRGRSPKPCHHRRQCGRQRGGYCGHGSRHF